MDGFVDWGVWMGGVFLGCGNPTRMALPTCRSFPGYSFLGWFRLLKTGNRVVHRDEFNKKIESFSGESEIFLYVRGLRNGTAGLFAAPADLGGRGKGGVRQSLLHH